MQKGPQPFLTAELRGSAFPGPAVPPEPQRWSLASFARFEALSAKAPVKGGNATFALGGWLEPVPLLGWGQIKGVQQKKCGCQSTLGVQSVYADLNRFSLSLSLSLPPPQSPIQHYMWL